MSMKNDFQTLIDDSMAKFRIERFVAIRIDNEFIVSGFISNPEELEEIIKPSGLLFLDEFDIKDELAYYLYKKVYEPIYYHEHQKDLFKLCEVIKTKSGIYHLPASIKNEIEELANIIEPLTPEQFVDFMVENHSELCRKTIEHYDQSSDPYSSLTFMTKVNLMDKDAVCLCNTDSAYLQAFVKEHYDITTEQNLQAWESERGFFISNGGDFIPVLKTHGKSYVALKKHNILNHNIEKEFLYV
ncbi:hypothetical protein BBL97_04465 [Vibrio parahaemolyticus]|uniref:hypothetical protein n=1 Tax=Vibrio parahaemolyticus TaxID=670 RepID=UPI00084B3856|nr:hypothetical protein [Vibrio parahaemolyticus]ODW92423.1 hypothetical protein BBL95_13050 [Vibrio parahaemolyticus]ODX07154.1 hypothetical protein BBL96_10535 [Vibrio parahaemolyticus]ODX10743.1 hypothetical protein BBL97_04465 [Vibrio parahaemolyticus]ODX14021.1 hypothetical protein BBL98_00545 [Vibrio parahaemolyticus]ODX18071.1 hypothetical protein BBL99_11830 [Vibrio parahaemolyticus]